MAKEFKCKEILSERLFGPKRIYVQKYVGSKKGGWMAGENRIKDISSSELKFNLKMSLAITISSYASMIREIKQLIDKKTSLSTS